MKTMMKHTFSLRWTSCIQAALGVSALALLTACGGGGGGGEPAAAVRFESTTVGAVAGVRDNSTGVVWAAQLAISPASGNNQPFVHELQAVADAGVEAIRTHFPFLVGKEVPTNQTSRNLGIEPWVVSYKTDMLGGLRNDVPLADAAHWRVLQRPTVSTAPANFVYAENGTVTQGNVLMWRLCSEGSLHLANTDRCTGTPSSLSMDQAKALTGSTYATYTNWRLPTKQELQTMLRLSNSEGSLLASPFKEAEGANFPSMSVLEYWTSTPSAMAPASEVWAVDFSLGTDPGGVSLAPISGPILTNTAFVRMVRNLR